MEVQGFLGFEVSGLCVGLGVLWMALCSWFKEPPARSALTSAQRNVMPSEVGLSSQGNVICMFFSVYRYTCRHTASKIFGVPFFEGGGLL